MTTSESPNLPVSPANPTIETPTNPIVNAPTENSQVSTIKPTEKPTKKNPIILVLLAVLLLIIVAAGAYLFWYNSKEKNTTPNDGIITPSSVPSISPTEAETFMKTYTGSTGFSFNYSDISWTLSEKDVAIEVPGLDGLQEYSQIKLEHNLEDYELIINYKPKDSDSDMTLYGGAAGDFVLKGVVDFMGEDLSKYALVWEGQDTEMYYNKWEEFTRGDTTFSIVLRPVDFEGVLNAGIIEQADLVLSNFKLSSTNTTTSTKTYSSPILEDFSFQYPSSWTIKVEEKIQDGESVIMSNTITLTRDAHALEIAISPLVVFGGTTECFKTGDIDYDIANEVVRVFYKDSSGNIQYKSFTYFDKDVLQTREHSYEKFVQALENMSVDSSIQSQYTACGVLDFSSAERSTYLAKQSNFADLGGVDPNSKLMAIIDIGGSYTGGQNATIQNEMDDIVTNILKN